MRILSLILLLVYYGVSEISTQQNLGRKNTSLYAGAICNDKLDVLIEYQSATYETAIQTYKSIAFRSNFNFVYSPTAIWIILAAVAEGTEPDVQEKIFQVLSMSKDPCIRHSFYQLATTRALPTSDVIIRSNRVMLIDDGLTLNPTWYEIIQENTHLLNLVRAPIRFNTVATSNQIKEIMSTRLPDLDLRGNSVLLHTLDFKGLWTTAFADATIERAPFYNQAGEKTGYVDLMMLKRRARMAYLKKIHCKVLELPVGLDGRLRMLFGMTIANHDISPVVATVSKDLIFELFDSFRESYVQLDIAIPRMEITSEVNVRSVLEDLGVNELWTDRNATRLISEPPAYPTDFVQRSTIVFNNEGLAPPSIEAEPVQSLRTGLEPILGRDFIANRPFLFALFDAETRTCMVAAAYSVPTYPL